MSYRSSPPLYAMSRRSRAPPSRLELPRPRIWPNLARSRGESSDNESSNKPLRRRAEDGFIDLTRELTPSPPRSLGPHGTSPYANGDARTLKRRRLDGEMRHREPTQEPIASSSTQQTRNAYEVDLTGDLDFEEVDMTGVDDEIGLRRIQNAQRERHEMQNKVHEKQNQLLKDSVQAQTTESKGPIRLGQLQCVICLENMTNITATHCGHLFCHTCIMEALIAGERQSAVEDPSKPFAKCPVCRKRVKRNAKAGQEQVIPLELKFVAKSSRAKGKERVQE